MKQFQLLSFFIIALILSSNNVHSYMEENFSDEIFQVINSVCREAFMCHKSSANWVFAQGVILCSCAAPCEVL